MFEMIITNIRAREIMDSLGNPTVEVNVELEGGAMNLLRPQGLGGTGVEGMKKGIPGNKILLAFCLGLFLLGKASIRGADYDDSISLPNMMGDFSPLPQGLMSSVGFDFDAMVGLSGGAGRTLVSRNNSVFPLTRAYFDYSFSDAARFDAAADARTGDIHQGIIGIERAFFDDRLSFEIRLPMVNGFDDSQNAVVDRPAQQGTDFGNMYLGTKALLYCDEQNVLTAGVGFTLPTGNSTEYLSGSTIVASIENEAGYIQPFVAYAHTRGRGFLQTWAELDLAMGGNDVFVGSTFRDDYQEQSLLKLDVQVGYWLYQDGDLDGLVTGIAPLLELHYTGTLNNSDRVNFVQDYENPFNQMDILNATVGTQINLGRRANCRLGVALPLLDGQFDEAQVADATFFVQFEMKLR